ncbi:Uncharacterised protein [Mycobacteroides abscessus subsp. abscessus]|nr:Uncharacterised protein [Mycobacteroides abscessus subsp. abscessus]
MHGDAAYLHIAQRRECLTNTFRRRTADGTRDDDDLGPVQLALDHLAERGGLRTDDAHAVDVGAGITGRSRQRVGIHVVHLAVARSAVDVNKLTADADHR